jgi:predicted amidohydrolase YtcJ
MEYLLCGRVSNAGASGRDANAVLIDGNTIVAVGGGLLREHCRNRHVPEIDLGDRYIAPGFVDVHTHLEVGARALAETVDCRVPRCKSVSDVLQTLSESRDRARDGWLVAQANLFFDQKLSDRRFPTREELDSVASDIAIVIRAGGHVSILNTLAFELSGVAEYEGKTGMMGGAVIERRSDGSLSGVIAELDGALPFPGIDDSELESMLIEGAAELFTRYGVTFVGTITETLPGARAVQQLAEDGTLGLRVSSYLWVPGTTDFESALEPADLLAKSRHPMRHTVRGIKIFADGGYSSRNAATRVPYREPYALTGHPRGQLSLNQSQLRSMIERSRQLGLQLAVHANGERAQDEVGLALASLPPPTSSLEQVRIEHAGNVVTAPQTTSLWETRSVIPIPQPVFLYNFGDYFEPFLGPEIVRGLFPFRGLIDHGFELTGSSDLHLGSEPNQTNPMFSIWCCMRRQTFSGACLLAEQAIDFQEALDMHTINAARLLGADSQLGSVHAGKLADLVIFDVDPSTKPLDELASLEPTGVILDGRLARGTPGIAAQLSPVLIAE